MFIVRTLIFGILLFFVSYMHAQCPVEPEEGAPPKTNTRLPETTGTQKTDSQETEPSQTANTEDLLPESAYLSNRTYTSVFFGLGLDLPIPVDGHRVMLPLMPSGQHALLALVTENGTHHGSLTITASEPSNPGYVMSEKERQEEFQRWAKNQPSVRQEMPDWMMRSGHFYHTEMRKGDERTVQYTTRIKNYLIRIKVTSNDPTFLKNALHDIETIRIYCPEDDGTLTTRKGDLVTPEGTPYEGPTVPTSRVDARIAENPEQHAIPAGVVDDGIYKNPELGVEFTLPQGWQVVPEPPLANEKEGATAQERRTQAFLQACSQVLVRLKNESPVVHQGSPPVIVLRALDPACISLRGPNTVEDRRGADDLAAYLEMLREFGEIRTTELVSVSDHTFAVYGGTVDNGSPEQSLAERASQMIIATRYNKLLLLWSLTLPQGSTWKDIPDTSVRFGGNESVDVGPALAKK